MTDPRTPLRFLVTDTGAGVVNEQSEFILIGTDKWFPATSKIEAPETWTPKPRSSWTSE